VRCTRLTRDKLKARLFYPNQILQGVEMNKSLETIRGSWLTRETETAEANREVLRNSIDQIPANLREKFSQLWIGQTGLKLQPMSSWTER